MAKFIALELKSKTQRQFLRVNGRSNPLSSASGHWGTQIVLSEDQSVTVEEDSGRIVMLAGQ